VTWLFSDSVLRWSQANLWNWSWTNITMLSHEACFQDQQAVLG